MAKGIQDIGIGLGYLYKTAPDGVTIVATQPNTLYGVKNMREQGVSSAPFVANRPAVGTITVNSVAGVGAVTAVNIGGVNQIGANVTINTSNTILAAGLIANAINAHSPVGSPNYTAESINSVVYVFSPANIGSTVNGLTITVSVNNVTIVTTTTALTNGNSANEVYDTTFGARFYIDADYGLTGVPGGGAASPTSLANAYEITEYFVVRGLQTGIMTVNATIFNDSISGIVRSCSFTQILISNQGAAPSDVLAVLATQSFVVGDYVQLVAANSAQVPIIQSAPVTPSPVPTPNIYLTDDLQMSLTGLLSITLQLRVNSSGNLVWSEVSRSMASIGVSSWNTLSGAITATTANLDDSANRRYVTDSQRNALTGTSGVPSNTNRYVTDADPRLAIPAGVSSWNTLVGAVVATTANLNDSIGRRYVTDGQKDALVGTAGVPSSLNKYVTDTDPRLAVPAGVSSWNTLVGAVVATTANLNDSVNRRYVTDAQQSALLGTSGTPSNTNRYVTNNDARLVGLPAIPTSEKGAINGVATLDATGKVPASQLPLTGTSFKGNWDATANTPTLSDATGVGGDYYFVQNGATRNLGSGNVNWTTGALIIHNGTIWIENEAVNNVLSVAGKQGAVTLNLDDVTNSASRFAVSANVNAALGAANAPSGANPIATIADIGPGGGVTSWNTLSGAVNVTTANLNDSTNRRYVTDNQRDALLGTTGTPSNTNRYVTDLDPRLGASVTNNFTINISGGLNLVTGYGDGVNQVGGQETSRLLSSLGYTNATAATRWPQTAARWGGITANATEYDEVCLQEALLTLENSRLRYLGLGTPILLVRRSAGIILPGYSAGYSSNTNRPFQFVIDLMGGLIRGIATQNYLLTSDIPNHTIATRNIEHRILIQNGSLQMAGSSVAGVVLRVGASYAPEFRNLYIDGGQIGIYVAFCLLAGFYNIRAIKQTLYCYRVDTGGTWWTGIPSPACAAAGNQAHFYNCMAKPNDANAIGFYIRAADTSSLRDCSVEGNADLNPALNSGLAAVYYDDANCTVSRQFTIENFRFELFGDGVWADSIFKLRNTGSYKTRIRGCYLQMTRAGGPAINLINVQCDNTADGAARIDIEDVQYSNDNKDGFTFKRTGTGWLRMRVKDVRLIGNPQTGDAMLTTPGLWGAGSNQQPRSTPIPSQNDQTIIILQPLF